MDSLPGLEAVAKRRSRTQRESVFPISEIFGFDPAATSPEARAAQSGQTCPFAGGLCEKQRQYDMGYCSVSYSAADDGGVRYNYAVCDHRMDGAPLEVVLAKAFGGRPATLVPEVQLTNPKMAFDYVAVEDGNPENAIVIETQAIDLRGGGVKPAFDAWRDGKMDEWRAYFTRDRERRKRTKDDVAYGVNMANVYKRIGTQIAVKGVFLALIGVPMYVVMQDRVFAYLRKRVRFAEEKTAPNLTFATFDYDGKLGADGKFGFGPQRWIQTTVDAFNTAMTKDAFNLDEVDRADFLSRVKTKAQLSQPRPS